MCAKERYFMTIFMALFFAAASVIGAKTIETKQNKESFEMKMEERKACWEMTKSKDCWFINHDKK